MSAQGDKISNNKNIDSEVAAKLRRNFILFLACVSGKKGTQQKSKLKPLSNSSTEFSQTDFLKGKIE
jgi:hypothetical protein